MMDVNVSGAWREEAILTCIANLHGLAYVILRKTMKNFNQNILFRSGLIHYECANPPRNFSFLRDRLKRFKN
jgi:hypothetical protein